MLGAVVDALPPLGAQLEAAVGPLYGERERIRAALVDAGAIRPLGTDPAYLSLSAIDGAYTLSPLFVGDQINTLALAVRSDLSTGALEIEGHRSDGAFLPHSPGNELLAKVMMMASELELLALPRGIDAVAVIDGSHLTAATALMEALVDPGCAAAQYVLGTPGLADAVVAALDVVAGAGAVVACPKSDSSTDVAEYVAGLGVESPMRFPDKVVASMVLDEGEVLAHEASHAPWGRYDLMRHQVTSHEVSRHQVSARDMKERIDEAMAPLRENGLTIAHIKPHGSPTAIRVETKAAISDFDANDYWQALAADCAPAYVQEPAAQFLADHLAKDVSRAATVQIEAARLDIAENPNSAHLLEFLTRSYRTA